MSETTDARADYFEYLENVLGIKTILQTQPINSSQEKTEIELLFCVQDYKTYTAEENDLLYKMVASVKVDPTRLTVCDSNEVHKFEAKCLVVFEDQPEKDQSRKDQLQEGRPREILIEVKLVVHTFSPRILMKKPELKKIAWTELQKILQYFLKPSFLPPV